MQSIRQAPTRTKDYYGQIEHKPESRLFNLATRNTFSIDGASRGQSRLIRKPLLILTHQALKPELERWTLKQTISAESPGCGYPRVLWSQPYSFVPNKATLESYSE